MRIDPYILYPALTWSEDCCLYDHILFLKFVSLVNRENCFTLCHQPKTQIPEVVMHPLSACIIIYSCILHSWDSFCIIISSWWIERIASPSVTNLKRNGRLVRTSFLLVHEGWWATCNWIGQLRLGFRRIWRKDLSKNSNPDECIIRLIGGKKRGVDGIPTVAPELVRAPRNEYLFVLKK